MRRTRVRDLQMLAESLDGAEMSRQTSEKCPPASCEQQQMFLAEDPVELESDRHQTLCLSLLGSDVIVLPRRLQEESASALGTLDGCLSVKEKKTLVQVQTGHHTADEGSPSKHRKCSETNKNIFICTVARLQLVSY